jgi:hypothetical protein
MQHEGGDLMIAIKTVGSSGQIALGKKYAGRHVTVEEREPGVWVVKLGEFIPDNERWLQEPKVREKLDRAIARAESEPLRETDLKELERKILGGS